MPSQSLTVEYPSWKMAPSFFYANEWASPALESGKRFRISLISLIINIHSYCAFFLRQHGGPSERFLLNPVAGGWDGCQVFFFVCFFLQQHWHVFRLGTAWLKATCYTLSLTHTQLQTHTQTVTNYAPHTEEAASSPLSPPIVIWCELLLNLISRQTLLLIQLFHWSLTHIFIKMHFVTHDNKLNNKLILKLKCPNSSVNTGHCIILALLAATLLEKTNVKQRRLSNRHPAN